MHLIESNAFDWLLSKSPLAMAFPVVPKSREVEFELGCDAVEVQQNYSPSENRKTRFASSGACINGKVWTIATKAAPIDDFFPYIGQQKPLTLGDIVDQTQCTAPSVFIEESSLERWRHLKGAKSTPRIAKSGHAYTYSEGAVPFPDPLDRPARTILTSEGGKAASRTKHVVEQADGRLRRLTAEEIENLSGFPRGYTAVTGLSESHRAFLIGNALVTGVVTRIGQELTRMHEACSGTSTAALAQAWPLSSANENADAANDETFKSRDAA